MGNHYAKQRPPMTAAAPACQDVGTLLDNLRAELPDDFSLGIRLPPRPGPSGRAVASMEVIEAVHTAQTRALEAVPKKCGSATWTTRLSDPGGGGVSPAAQLVH